MPAKQKPRVARTPDRVPLAQIKTNFSRYVREAQMRGRSIIITQHGRDAAVLAPLSVTPRPALTIREPIDPRPLGLLKLRPPKGQGTSAAAIRRALDEERRE
jgi:prevent-host-death family protein